MCGSAISVVRYHGTAAMIVSTANCLGLIVGGIMPMQIANCTTFQATSDNLGAVVTSINKLRVAPTLTQQ